MEIRRIAATAKNGIIAINGKMIANRIDAAHKREVEKLNSVIQATVSRSDAEIDRLRREVAELRKQIGNAAKMREALKVVRGMVNEELEDLKDISDEVRADFFIIRAWCDHALAKPPRNCDLYDGQEAWLQWQYYCAKMAPRTLALKFSAWLLDTAKEKEVFDGSK